VHRLAVGVEETPAARHRRRWLDDLVHAEADARRDGHVRGAVGRVGDQDLRWTDIGFGGPGHHPDA